MLTTARRFANCHPELPYYARGFCRRCYELDLLIRNPAYADRQRENSRKWEGRNTDRYKEYTKKYRSQPEYKKRRRAASRARTLARFGFSLLQAEEVLRLQDNKCAICGCSEKQYRFRMDHDHSTGKFRGFLCQGCNVALGIFKDSPQILEKALEYIKNPPAWRNLK